MIVNLILLSMINSIFIRANVITHSSTDHFGEAPIDPAEHEFIKKAHTYNNNHNYQSEFSLKPDHLSFCKKNGNKEACYQVKTLQVTKTRKVDCKDGFLDVFFEYQICDKDIKCEKIYHSGYLLSKPTFHISESKVLKSNDSCQIKRWKLGEYTILLINEEINIEKNDDVDKVIKFKLLTSLDIWRYALYIFGRYKEENDSADWLRLTQDFMCGVLIWPYGVLILCFIYCKTIGNESYFGEKNDEKDKENELYTKKANKNTRSNAKTEAKAKAENEKKE